MNKSFIQLTNAACNRILYLCDIYQYYGIRLSLKTYGCSGKAYDMNGVNEHQPNDEVVSVQNKFLFIDKSAVLFLINTTVDFIKNNHESEFVFINPNVTHSCGCGKSVCF